MNTLRQSSLEFAVFGGGCFWCTEAVFEALRGVSKVTSGYTGGTLTNPSYEQVSVGNTGHAEAIKIEFDPSQISYEDLLIVFFNTHNPTTLNRQGADVGTQYRSAIFYTSPEQMAVAEKVIKELTDAKAYDRPIVTEVTPFQNFYDAESYHQNYYKQNKNEPYCELVIAPKMAKFEKKFADLLKNSKSEMTGDLAPTI